MDQSKTKIKTSASSLKKKMKEWIEHVHYIALSETKSNFDNIIR